MKNDQKHTKTDTNAKKLNRKRQKEVQYMTTKEWPKKMQNDLKDK